MNRDIAPPWWLTLYVKLYSDESQGVKVLLGAAAGSPYIVLKLRFCNMASLVVLLEVT